VPVASLYVPLKKQKQITLFITIYLTFLYHYIAILVYLVLDYYEEVPSFDDNIILIIISANIKISPFPLAINSSIDVLVVLMVDHKLDNIGSLNHRVNTCC